MRVKMSKPPPPAHTASAIDPCPTVIKIVGRPTMEVYPAPSHHATTSSSKYKLRRAILFVIYLFIIIIFFLAEKK